MNIVIAIDDKDKNLWILVKYISQIELLLGMNEYYHNEMINPQDGYYEDPQYLQHLPDSIANDISIFMKNIYRTDISKYDLVNKYDRFFSDSSIEKIYEFLEYMMNYRNLLCEGLIYTSADETEENCRINTISVNINNQLYGHTFIFQKDIVNYMIMQGISKMFPMAIIDFFYPEFKTIYNLNSLIHSTLIPWAKLNSFTDIIVNPIGKQGDILSKYYGYIKEYQKFIPFCPVIFYQHKGKFRYRLNVK